MNDTALSLADVITGLEGIAQDAQKSFGSLGARQLNCQPDAARWSVAQCFDHLLTTNALMSTAADEALNGTKPPTLWQRLPLIRGVLGRMLIRSMEPGSTRTFTAPSKAQPATSDIAAGVIQRYIVQHREIVALLQSLDVRRAARVIMVSPFSKMLAYSVLDGFRLVLAHDRRHVEQARHVTMVPGFQQEPPGS